jgi:hypothetical protein
MSQGKRLSGEKANERNESNMVKGTVKEFKIRIK